MERARKVGTAASIILLISPAVSAAASAGVTGIGGGRSASREGQSP